MTKDNYAKDIKELREHYKLKAQELSKKANLSVLYVTNIENHKTRTPRLDCLLELGMIFNIERVCRGESFCDLEKRFDGNVMIDIMRLSNSKRRLTE